MTVPWIELGGKITITCAKTGYYANIEFHTKVRLHALRYPSLAIGSTSKDGVATSARIISASLQLLSSPGGRVVRALALIDLCYCVLPVGGSNPKWDGSQGVKSLTCYCLWGRDIK